MVMPVFVVLIWLYLIYVKKINFKQTVALAIPLCILAIPLILMHIINMAGLEEMKVGIFTIPKLYRYRSDDLSYEDIIKNLVNFFKTTLLYDKLKFNSFVANFESISVNIDLENINYDDMPYEKLEEIRTSPVQLIEKIITGTLDYNDIKNNRLLVYPLLFIRIIIAFAITYLLTKISIN